MCKNTIDIHIYKYNMISKKRKKHKYFDTYNLIIQNKCYHLFVLHKYKIYTYLIKIKSQKIIHF